MTVIARLAGLSKRVLRAPTASRPGPADESPFLLDQAGARQLLRLAAGDPRFAPNDSAPMPSKRSYRARRPLAGLRRATFPFVLLGLGAAMTGALAYGAIASATDADGVSLADAPRLALMALAALTFIGQAAALGGRLPGGRWLAARLARRDRPAGPWPILLDQATAQDLRHLAPSDLGRSASSLGRSGRRWLDLGSWFILAAAALALIGLTTAGLAISTSVLLLEDGVGLPLLLRVLFLGLAAFGLMTVAIVGLSGLADRHRRRRRRLLKRLLRYLLRAVDASARAVKGGGYESHPVGSRVPTTGSFDGGQGPQLPLSAPTWLDAPWAGLRFAVASAAAVAVVALALVPDPSQGGVGGGDPLGAPAADSSLAQFPNPGGSVSASTAPSSGGPTGASEAPEASPAAPPTGDQASTEPFPTPAPSPPAGPTPRPTPRPTARPVPTPTVRPLPTPTVRPLPTPTVRPLPTETTRPSPGR